MGTPPLANGDADLSAIEGVARAIAKRASGYRLVIEKSTVPVQTGAQLRKHLSVHSTNGLKYDVASNPEFLREGTSVEDFLHPDRIVIGVDSPRAAELLREIYEPIVTQTFTCPIHSNCAKRKEPVFLVTDTGSAELIKHASNSFLAMKISFINMVANLCEAVGADVSKVAQGMGLDPRIGPAFLNPGIGFGGFCFPKDVQAFIRIAEKSGCDFSLLKEVEKINQRRVEHFVEKIRKELWVVRGKKIAVWGLAFKPNTDDVRFAPSIAPGESPACEKVLKCVPTIPKPPKRPGRSFPTYVLFESLRSRRRRRCHLDRHRMGRISADGLESIAFNRRAALNNRREECLRSGRDQPEGIPVCQHRTRRCFAAPIHRRREDRFVVAASRQERSRSSGLIRSPKRGARPIGNLRKLRKCPIQQPY